MRFLRTLRILFRSLRARGALICDACLETGTAEKAFMLEPDHRSLAGCEAGSNSVRKETLPLLKLYMSLVKSERSNKGDRSGV